MTDLKIGKFEVRNRLFVGTGKYATTSVMQPGAGRQRLPGGDRGRAPRAAGRQGGRSLLDFLDLDRYVILPNTAGCFSAEDAVRVVAARPRSAGKTEKPRSRLGQAGSARRQENPAPRPDRHARSHPRTGEGRLHRSLLHQRRSDRGPAAEGSRRRQRHARRQPDRLGAGRAQSAQHFLCAWKR
jgi:hypothetical protein